MIEKLGHYKIVSELGRGGMGVVYKAYEESLNRYVAIKVLGEHLTHDDNFAKRFVREARAAAGLSHPNIIQIYFIGQEDGRHYFVMEFVEGRSVHDMLAQDGPLDPLRATRIVQQSASGLAAAHDQGLLHRDIKPANLLVTKGLHVKILDFGLALAPTDVATRLTATNSLVGTVGYLSPEQCCGEPAGPRSDIYALGMTFYEMLTGSTPFKGESPLAVLRQILDEEPPPLLQIDADLDPRIAKTVERMVAKEPNDRYQTCHEVLADLSEILSTPRSTAVAPISATVPVAVPPAPVSRSSAPRDVQARVVGNSDNVPTAAVAMNVAAGGASPVGVPPPPPSPAGAAAAGSPAEPAVPAPVVVANAHAKSGTGGRWVLIGAMAVLIVIAVSAAGLYFAAPILKDAPFLRDVPFLKPSSFLKYSADPATVGGESTASTAVSSTDAVAEKAEADSGAATFETTSPSTGDAQPMSSTVNGGAEQTGSSKQVAEAAAGNGSTDAASQTGAARVASGDAGGAGRPRSLASAPTDPARAESPAANESKQQAPPAAPPRRAPIRENPRVSVIAVGEPMFAGAAEEALESQLGRHGVDLYDERGILELRDAGGPSRLAPSSILGMVAGRGVDVLVLIDVEPVSERELDALGRYSHATTARVRVDAYLAADGDAIGRGWSEQVEYAQPNAASKADGAMGRVSTAVAESIDAAWQDHRAGAR